MAERGPVKSTVAPVPSTGAGKESWRDRGAEQRGKEEEKRRKQAEQYPGEAPPTPITSEYPGEEPPYPKGYTPPGGKVVEVDAKGKPTVIETSAGLRQYTPNSTMYKMGYLTSDDYMRTGARFDNPVKVADYLPIESEKKGTLLISRKVAEDLQNKSAREQFNALKEMGVIEKGSRFVSGEDGGWSYETERSVRKGERLEKELSATQKATTVARRKGQTKLPGNMWIDTAELKKIQSSNPTVYKVLTDKGYDEYQKQLEDARDTLSVYYDENTDAYNVGAAMLKRNKNTDDAINLLFKQSDVDDVKGKILPGLTIGTGVTYPKRTAQGEEAVTRYGDVEYGLEFDIPAADRKQALDTAQRRLDKLSEPFTVVVDKVGEFLEDYKERIKKTGEIVSDAIKKELDAAFERQQKYIIDTSLEQDMPPASREAAFDTARKRAANIYEPLNRELQEAQERAQERLKKLNDKLQKYIEERKKATSIILADALQKQQKYDASVSPELDLPPQSRQEAVETAQARINQLDVETADEINKVQSEIDDIADRYQKSGEIVSSKVQDTLEESYEKQAKSQADISPSADLPPASREKAIATAKARAALLLKPVQDVINSIRGDFDEKIEPLKKAANKTGDNIQKILDESYEKQQKSEAYNIPKKAWLTAGVLTVVPEPATTLTGIAMLAALTGIAAYNVKQSGLDLTKVREWAKSEAADYAKKMQGYYIKLQDVIMVDNKGNAASVIDIDPSLQHGEILVPPTIQLKPGEELKPPRLEIKEHGTTLTPPQVLRVQEAIKQYRPEVVFLPTPVIKPEDITKQRAGVMRAEAAVREAERNVRALPQTKTIPVDWNKILEEEQQKARDAAWAKVVESLNAAVSQEQITPEVSRNYKDAYAEYLRKKALLDAAKKSFIKSLNPTPIKGNVNASVLDAYSKYLFDTEGRITTSKSSLIQMANDVALNTYTDALAQGDSSTQAKQQASTAVKNALATAVSEDVLTETQAQALTRTAVNTAVDTASRTMPTTAEAARTAEATETLTKPIVMPKPSGGDKEDRKKIKESDGAIAWRQGEVNGKDVWHVIMYPYKTIADHVTVIGKKPSNTTLIKGPGSAYQTVKLRYGKAPSRRVTGDIGIFDFYIEPKGERSIGIGFKTDTKLQTRGDITIGTPRPRISGRMTRISPRMPKLRR